MCKKPEENTILNSKHFFLLDQEQESDVLYHTAIQNNSTGASKHHCKNKKKILQINYYN